MLLRTQKQIPPYVQVNCKQLLLKRAPFFKSHRDLVTPAAEASTPLIRSLRTAEPRRGCSWVLEGTSLGLLPFPSHPNCCYFHWVQTSSYTQESAGWFPLSREGWKKKEVRRNSLTRAHSEKSGCFGSSPALGRETLLLMMWFRKKQ